MRSSFFGGFNRKDVQGYIEILYRRIHDLEEANRKLQEEAAAPEVQTSQTVPEQEAVPVVQAASEPVAVPVAESVPEPVAHPASEAVPEPANEPVKEPVATTSVKPKKVVRVKRAGL